MKKYSEDFAIMGLKALKRASNRAKENAKKSNLKIPVWRNGKIEYISPENSTEQAGALDRYSAGASVCQENCVSTS